MKHLFAALCLALPAFLAQAQGVALAESRIEFTSRQMGVPVQGRFTRFAADVVFDTAKPEASRAKLDVDMASATMGLADIDAELRKPEWFDTARHPRATFVASRISGSGGALRAEGTLTIKGMARPLTVPVTIKDGVASGQFAIPRLAYKIGGGDWGDTSVVADEVQVRFTLKLTPR